MDADVQECEKMGGMKNMLVAPTRRIKQMMMWRCAA